MCVPCKDNVRRNLNPSQEKRATIENLPACKKKKIKYFFQTHRSWASEKKIISSHWQGSYQRISRSQSLKTILSGSPSSFAYWCVAPKEKQTRVFIINCLTCACKGRLLRSFPVFRAFVTSSKIMCLALDMCLGYNFIPRSIYRTLLVSEDELEEWALAIKLYFEEQKVWSFNFILHQILQLLLCVLFIVLMAEHNSSLPQVYSKSN